MTPAWMKWAIAILIGFGIIAVGFRSAARPATRHSTARFANSIWFAAGASNVSANATASGIFATRAVSAGTKTSGKYAATSELPARPNTNADEEALALAH